SELHSILHAVTRATSNGKDRRRERGIDRRLRVDTAAQQRAQHYLINPEAHLRSIGLRYVNVDRDYPNIMKYFSRHNTETFISRIRIHGDVGSREVDAQAVAHVGRFIRNANRACS